MIILMMNKRGLGEQFNWIFIIISGAIILGFFTMFAVKYIDLEQNKEDLQSIRDFGNVLSALEKLQTGDNGASIDSNNPEEGLRFGYKLRLYYNCQDAEAKISINDGGFATYQLNDEIIFTENEQYVHSLDMWLLPWRFPFHITNIIYLSDISKKYYLVYDSSNRDYINNLELSEAFDFQIVESSNFEPKENSKVVFFTSRGPSEKTIESLKEGISDINFIYIDTGKKMVTFYDNGWGKTVEYYADELMYGAIFSSDSESYDCGVKKALSKSRDVGNLVIEKANVLNQINKNTGCNYNNLANMIRNFMAGKYDLLNQIEKQNKPGSGCLWLY